MMRTLLHEQFAPITSKIGYLRLDLDEATAALAGWLRDITPGGVAVEHIDAGFPGCLETLEPLTAAVVPRHLLVEVSGNWTAYFNCSLRGTDAVSAIGHLTRQVGCQGLIIITVPHTANVASTGRGRLGAVQFQMFGPLETDFLNYVRTIAVGSDGRRWEFEANGTPQWFEEMDAYQSRRVRDRFTSVMLERYCAALDLKAFEPSAYGPRAMLLHQHVPVPEGAYVMNLAEAQQWLGIVPGQADELPG